MNGPRGSLVIGLLFLIAGQLGFIAGALTRQPLHNLVGVAMTLLFVLSLVRVGVELFREGQADADAATPSRRPARVREVPAPVTATSMLDPDGGVSQLDPQKRRSPHD